MGRIKAYKQADKLIPVGAAKVVTAFQCPWTKKIYAAKKDYIRHLKVLRQNRMHARIKHERMLRMVQDLNDQPSFEHIIEWIERNSYYFLARAKQSGFGRASGTWPEPEDFWIKITYLAVRHTDEASNSHCRPRDGVTNWDRRGKLVDGSPAPTGYPGWVGNIEYQLSHDLPIWSSDMFKAVGINTGGKGGISNGRYGYAVTFFDADWPGLSRMRIEQILKEEQQHAHIGTPAYFR